MASHEEASEDSEAELQKLTESLSRLTPSEKPELKPSSPKDLQKPESKIKSGSPSPNQLCKSGSPSLEAPDLWCKSGSASLAPPDQRCKSGSPSPGTPDQRRKSGPTASVAVPDHIPAHWEEIIKLQKRLSTILHCRSGKPYIDGARVSPEDEVVLRDVLKYHPKCEEKIGPGIDHIKIKKYMYEYTICFWVVRVDGTEIDFSYHKCLKEKAAKECPDLLPQYDALFKSFNRP